MTTHNILMKPDGTGEADLRSIIFSNGEPIFVMGKATGKVVDPAPIGETRRKPNIPNPLTKTSRPKHNQRPGRSHLQPRNRRIQLQSLHRQITT